MQIESEIRRLLATREKRAHSATAIEPVTKAIMTDKRAVSGSFPDVSWEKSRKKPKGHHQNRE